MFKQYTFVFILIIIHELGHALTGKILGFKFDKIIIYPYGGITKFNTLENHSLNKEMIVILMGPLMQFLGYLIINYYFHYEYIKLYNYSILIFNLLPILSLDGGLFVNLILNKFFSYRKSFYISFIISLFGIAYLILYSFKYYYNLNLFFMKNSFLYA